MTVLFTLSGVYSIVSYLIAIIDLIRLKVKKKDMANLSLNDLGEFLGIRNYIFLPSCIIILVVIGVIKLLKRVFN